MVGDLALAGRRLCQTFVWMLVGVGMTAGLHTADSGAAPSDRTLEWVTAARSDAGPTGAGPAPFTGPANQGMFLSPDGTAVLYPGSDPFAGQTGTQATFRAERNDGVWLSRNMFPPIMTGRYMLFRFINTMTAADDLSRIVLVGGAPLLTEDTNTTDDIYLATDAGDLTLLSPGSTDPVRYVGRSADAEQIVYQTRANLVPEATGTATKLYEWHDGVISLVGIKPDGAVDAGGASLVQGNESVRDAAISHDGSRIVFQSPDPEFATPADPVKIYVRIDGTQTVEVSQSHCTRVDCNAASDAKLQWVSGDSRYVFFTTKEQLLDGDTDGDADLYRYDVHLGQVERLSGGEGVLEGAQAVLGASSDGNRVYFDGLTGLQAWDNGELRKIGGPSNTIQAQVRAIGGCSVPNPEVTPDGAFLLIETSSPFEPVGSAEPGPGIWRYDLVQQAWDLVAPISSGTVDAGPGGMLGRGSGDCATNRSMTDDGTRVFFQTNDQAAAGDVDDELDVYEWHSGEVSLVSPGRRNYPSTLLMASHDGRDVMFETFDQLVPADRDDVFDVYDARIGGRQALAPVFPAPGCVEDDCQASEKAAPLLGTGVTTLLRARRPSAKARRAVVDISRISGPSKRGAMTVLLHASRGKTFNVALEVRVGRRWVRSDVARTTASRRRTRVTLALGTKALERLAVNGVVRIRVDASSVRGDAHDHVALRVTAMGGAR